MEKLVAFLFLLLLAPIGCSFNADYDRRLNKYASEYANEVNHSKKYLAMLEAHDFTTIEEKIDPSLKNTYQNSYELSQSVGLKDDKLHSMLDKMASLFPTGDPTDVKLVGIIRNYSGNYFSGRIGDFLLAGGTESTTAVSYEYNFSGKWLQANVVLRSKDNEIYIAGMNITTLSGPLEEISKFTLQGKKPINYIVLAATCVIPIFILFTLVACIRTPVPKRKWLWMAFILLGFASVTLNWTDSSININPLYVNLFGASFFSSPYSPVFLQFSFPLGAIVFLFMRKKWMPKIVPQKQA